MARQEINFTKAAIENLQAPPAGGRLEVYDAKTPHLRVRVSHTGRKVFEIYRWHQGRPTRIKIGVCVTDRPNGAGDDRVNGARRTW